jgi:magnesium chelatase family protein
LDRLDLHVEVPAVSLDSLTDESRGEGSAAVRERVCAARSVQVLRFGDVPGVYANAQMDVSLLRRFVRPSAAVVRTLQKAVDRRGLSARGFHRVLKVARTLADLDGSGEVEVPHVLEALQYRTLDRGP